MQGQNKRVLRSIQECPLRKLTISVHFNILPTLLIVLHPTMPSGIVFYKLRVLNVQLSKQFLLFQSISHSRMFP